MRFADASIGIAGSFSVGERYTLNRDVRHPHIVCNVEQWAVVNVNIWNMQLELGNMEFCR